MRNTYRRNYKVSAEIKKKIACLVIRNRLAQLTSFCHCMAPEGKGVNAGKVDQQSCRAFYYTIDTPTFMTLTAISVFPAIAIRSAVQ